MRKSKSLIALLVVIGVFLSSCATKSEEEKEPDAQIKEEVEDTRVSFVGVGDNLIHETVYQDAMKEDGSYDFTKMYSEVKSIVSQKDISFINQETILGGSELGLSGYPTFNSPSEIAKNLQDVGFNLVNLASNHSLDKGSAGIVNALDAMSKTDLIYDGIYASEEEYQKITTFEKKGIVFSFLSYTYGTNGIVPQNSYEISYFEENQIRSDIQRAKEVSDVVIVSAHWGDENTFAPSDYQAHYANLFTELEVDVVIGTHPHTIQPVEWKQSESGHQTLVVYSLGNFIGGMLTIDNAIGGMISFDFVKDKETEKISIENVKWDTVVIHFELKGADIMSDRYNYKAYLLEDYTDELAGKHALNGYEGQQMSTTYVKNKEEEVIGAEFR